MKFELEPLLNILINWLERTLAGEESSPVLRYS